MKNRLIQLFAKNQSRQPAALRAEGGAENDLFVYDVIGDDWFGGVKAEDFVRELKAIKGDTINLHIDSPGGDVFAAAAMGAALDASGKRVIAYIDGLAASAASKLAMHAHEVVIADGAFLMIHNAWTIAYGNRHDFIKQADILEKVDNSLVSVYVSKSGADADKIRAWMDAETWFTADEAVTEGFADRKAERQKTAALAWNLSAYDKTPEALIKPPKAESDPFPQPDRAAMERRVNLLSRIAP